MEDALLFNRGWVYYIYVMKMGKKALFINNTANQTEITGPLAGAGFTIDAAPDMAAGLKQLETQDYDIAVVIASNGSESWQLCEKIKSITAVPLIVVSGNASPEACVRAIYAGADYFMRKPFGPREFLARVNSLLQRPIPRQAVPIS
jgi:DNA-binding response OmpR family regulator